MAISRREAILLSGSTLAGLSLGVLTPGKTEAQAAQQEPWPDQLVERPMRPGFPVALPLNPDGSAPEHQASEAGTISDPIFWRTPDRSTPPGETDYTKMKIKV